MINEFDSEMWVESTIKYPFDGFVAHLLKSILYYLHESVSVFDENLSHFFDFDEKWIVYHKIDLNNLKALLQDRISISSNEEEKKMVRKTLKLIDEILGNDSLVINQSLIPLNYINWKVNFEDFELKEVIGDGQHSIVYKGIDKRNGKEVAIKKLKSGLEFNGYSLKIFRREIASLVYNLPCFVKFIGATEDPYCIIIEYMPNGSMGDHINKLTPLLKTMAAYDIARGMKKLHSKDIIHRDLKSLNILFNSDLHAYISDLGFSRHLPSNSYSTKNIGTVQWMAPELFSCDVPYDSKIDVYSYGIILWELVTGKKPYDNMKYPEILKYVRENKRPIIPNNVSLQLRELITSCWEQDPNERPTFKQIVLKFKKEGIVFDGTDINEFNNYIKENSFKKYLEKLINENNITKKEIYAKTLIKNKISIDKENAIKIAKLLPTDSKKLNKRLTILACRNGAADYAAVNLKYNPHIKFALLMIIEQKTFSSNLKLKISKICCNELKSNTDDSFSCIAYRCLIFLNETKKIPMNVFQKHINCDNQSLKNCMLIALVQNTFENDIQIIPNNILNFLYNESKSNKIAIPALLSCCNKINSADIIIDKLISENDLLIMNETTLRILYVISKFKSLQPKVIEFLEKYDDRNNKFQELYELLKHENV